MIPRRLNAPQVDEDGNPSPRLATEVGLKVGVDYGWMPKGYDGVYTMGI